MTQANQAPKPPASPLPDPAAIETRDLQRTCLEQLVRLSTQCSADEQRIEQDHASARAAENASLEKTLSTATKQHQRTLSDLASSSGDREAALQFSYDSAREALDTENTNQVRQIARQRETAEAALKKQLQDETWQSESALVQAEMKIDADEQKFNKLFDASQIELKGLAALKEHAHDALARGRMQPFPADDSISPDLQKRIATEPDPVSIEQRTQAQNLLKQLQDLTRPRLTDDVVPVLMIIFVAAIAAAVGWFVPPDSQTKLIAAGSAAGGAVLLGIILFLFLRARRRKRTVARAKALYVPLVQSVAAATSAATLDSEAAEEQRERRVTEARRKRDQETSSVREKVRTLQLKAIEAFRTATAEQTKRCNERLAALEFEKTTGLDELQKHRASVSQTSEAELEQIRQSAQAQHARAIEAIESKYAADSQALAETWGQGLRAVQELMALGTGIDPQLIDWNSPAWSHWKSPKEFVPQVRFGEMKVDLAQITSQVPQRLKLPETFNVPAMLTFPGQASLLIDADHAGRNASIDVARMIMARLLTQLPAGRVRFTIFDPVGLGQSFAGFMHLADHDEALVGSRIWTERDHIQQRLADLTEHMETVIQKYLRNEYATINQYNAQAGELAEPIRYLVLADFPNGFEQDALRRLSSIALTGARCGVYTIILRDTTLPIPPGTRMEEITAKSVHLRHKAGAFTREDEVFKKFPLVVDPPPEDKTLTRLMDMVGQAAKDAKRVEVPFESIAPANGEFWSLSSKEDLRVPIGKSGATRLQSLRLGIGVAQHALVAGKTGSGKSNLMHTIVTNMAMWYPPDEVEFYLVDFRKGVEFKAYATSQLPHARAIAVESDREFGLSVLQRVDAELSRRGALFRDAGAQEISAYRDKTNHRLGRCLLLIDEYQEFFSEDDKLAQEAAGLLDRIVRQGRAFGIHLVLGSQTIGGASGLGRSTLGQIAVRVALQCSEADSQIILGDNNSAARLLTRPGEAIYNDAGGLVEANSPFQIAFLPDAQRESFLEHIQQLSLATPRNTPRPIVFEGNSPASIRGNAPLMQLLEKHTPASPSSTINAWLGEPVAIKEPTAIPFRRQSGANVLMVGQQEESALAIFSSVIASIAAQQSPNNALFYILDGTPADSRFAGLLERVTGAVPHNKKIVPFRDVPNAINEIAETLKSRQADDSATGPSTFLFVFGIQRFRPLRRQEDDFSFSRGGSDNPAPKTDKQFAEILSEGPALGIHTLIWADTPITVERTFERGTMRQFDHRILFQMSANDSNNLIDSPLANRLGNHRALRYSEEQGTTEKFRPYQLPDQPWLDHLSSRLISRPT